MNSNNISLALSLIPKATFDTLYMVGAASFFSLILGLPLGIILFLTGKGGRKESFLLHKCLSTLVNIGRSFPFAILMIALIPFTRAIVGTSLGTTAAIVPLTIAAAPFFARIVEERLMEVDRHILEAIDLMGASTWQMITCVLIKEPLSSLVTGFGSMVINLIGYSAMAGLVGGGGLGKVAIQYGYNQFNIFIMITTVTALIILVQLVQAITKKIEQAILCKRGIISNE